VAPKLNEKFYFSYKPTRSNAAVASTKARVRFFLIAVPIREVTPNHAMFEALLAEELERETKRKIRRKRNVEEL